MEDPSKKPIPNQPEYGDKPWQNPDYGNKDKVDTADGKGCGCDSTSEEKK